MSLIIVEAYVYNSGQKRADRLCIDEQIIWNGSVYTVLNADFDSYDKDCMTVEIQQMQNDGVNLKVSCQRGTYFNMIDIGLKSEKITNSPVPQPAFERKES